MPSGSEAKRAAKENASEAVRQAKDAGRSMIEDQRRGAAGALGDCAQALRKAAGELDGERQGAARMMQWAADGLERASSTLGGKDVGTMVREVESFARAQPVAFFGAALAAGFLATRFLKASSPDSGDSGAAPAGLDLDLSKTTRI